MNSKELVLKNLNHQQTEKIAIDFGSNAVTGIHVKIVAELRRHYGLEDKPVKVIEPYQMLGELDEELKEIMGVDVEGVYPEKTLFGFPNKDWKEWETQWGQTVLVPGEFNISNDSSGGTLIYPKGDRTVAPSGKMPNGGYFFDSIVRQQPIVEDQLNPDDNLEEFSLVTDAELDYFEKEIKKASATDRAVMANFGGTAFGDIALIPAPFMKNPKGIRDIQEWYLSILMRPDYIHEVFDKQCNIAIENLKKHNARVGELVDVVFICGTDFGTQTSTFCSEETYRELYMPYYKRLNDWIHTNTKWKTFKHSCGAIESLVNPLIDSGFDILNPVQCSATGMEPQGLKDKYGDRIVFWGGGVDTQKTLPFLTPQKVRDEVKERCDIFSKNGGFVFNTIHNIQANVPIENVVAMIDTVVAHPSGCQ